MAIPSATSRQSSASDEVNAFNAFVELHRYQLASLPESLWPRLFNKLCNDTLDAGNYFCLAELDDEEAAALGSPYTLQVAEGKALARQSDIFLLDHAWTTTPERAREELEKNEALLERMANLMGIPEEEEEEEEAEEEASSSDNAGSVDSWTARDNDQKADAHEAMVELAAQQANVSKDTARAMLEKESWDLISAVSLLTLSDDAREAAEQLERRVMGDIEQRDVSARRAWRVGAVLNAMWRFAGTYQITMLNEKGEHREEYLWYVMDEMEAGCSNTASFLHQVGSAIRHSSTPNCCVVPFLFVRGPNTSDTISYCVMYPMQDLAGGDRISRNMVPADISDPLSRQAYLCAFSTPGPALAEQLIRSYKDNNARIQPLADRQLAVAMSPAMLPAASTGTLRVYSSATFIRQHLQLAGVELVDSREAADLLWLTEDFAEQFASLLPGQETYGRVDWYPETFNLVEELAPAVGCFLADALGEDAEKRKENLWILKPWNFGRSIGIAVTDNLSRLIRTRDSVPCIAQRYLCRPLLYDGRKFDLRYIVLVRAARPHLRVAVYRMFWIRLANKPFSLDDLHDYEKHFTVMNYSTYAMTQLRHTDFISRLERERPGLRWWSQVQPRIDQVIGHVFKAAALQPAPLGFSDVPSDKDAFAVYGIDMMLTDQLQPVLLEVNFSPDCLRACQYEPDFVNHLISAVTGRSGLDKAREMFRDLA
ncbi:tubulin-tyrosine ligase family-domain-containing protein [Syncephalis pseudoplumigaleata]|uniref:Tubulin-tyrosine ligase family-domain-containing protein n=1 Tax=Syncephalis pseudoplumigaleata TaxID=1712513 RepID=A0A4P9Z7K9_9FUNG|nr:tubulin-tyrosine ligase family-domain-containing protein [Syncephalis pseudoplumigaleata]|eukprot:RKP28192.1 tubulin-tyrosine ligase family-domain-containing protein [Syncephalis pseudoplumigaleata]